MYYLRTDAGHLIAEFTNETTREIINQLKGQWKPSVENPKLTKFVVESNMKFTNYAGYLSIFIFEGYYFVPKNRIVV